VPAISYPTAAADYSLLKRRTFQREGMTMAFSVGKVLSPPTPSRAGFEALQNCSNISQRTEGAESLPFLSPPYERDAVVECTPKSLLPFPHLLLNNGKED